MLHTISLRRCLEKWHEREQRKALTLGYQRLWRLFKQLLGGMSSIAPMTQRSRSSNTDIASIITVATYNIHGCVGRDRRFGPDRIVEVIRMLDADIVGLQEVDAHPGVATPSKQMAYLGDAAGYQSIAGPTIEHHERCYGNVLLTRWQPTTVRRLDLTVPGCEPRGLIDADFLIQDRHLRIMVTHLGLRARERNLQLNRLCRSLEGDACDTLVLVGDLNEWRPYGNALRLITKIFGRCPSLRSYPAGFPLLALDRICVRPRRSLGDVRVYNNPLTRLASDHLPISAQIGFER